MITDSYAGELEGSADKNLQFSNYTDRTYLQAEVLSGMLWNIGEVLPHGQNDCFSKVMQALPYLGRQPSFEVFLSAIAKAEEDTFRSNYRMRPNLSAGQT